jgi:opacity protein-like surface antigen
MKVKKFLMVAMTAALIIGGSTAALAGGNGKGGGGKTGSDQECSQRGGKNNSVDCSTSIIKVGDVTVTVEGDRILSDNEVTLVKAVIDTSDTAEIILGKVTVVVGSFDDYDEKQICVQKGLVNVCNVSLL